MSDLYPMRLFIYGHDGMHDGGIEIASEAELKGPGVKIAIRDAVMGGREVRITDPNDFLVFHAAGGKIIFPEDPGC